jgi:hypothetical protein
MLKTVSTSGGGGGGGNISSVTATTPLASSGGSTPDISLSGQVSVANGGTGKANLTLNNVILGNNTGAVLFVAPGTAGNVLTSNGTTWTSNAAAGGGGSGTVTSVGLVAPAMFTVTGSPVTTSGNLTLSYSGTALPVANGGTGVTISTGPSSVVLRDSSNNITANAYFNGFNSITASGTAVTLTVASAPVQYVSGSGGQTIKLPDATTLLNGTIFSFNNNQSSGAITVNNNSNTLVVSVPSGGYTTVVLLSNATAAGSWDRHDQTPANVSWSTNTFSYPGTITSATWNGAAVGITYGGTGQTTASAAFNALSPVTTTGDLIIGNGTNSATRLAIGANTYVLTSNGTTASWTAPSSFTFPTAGIVYSTGSAWATSYTTSGTGTVVALATGATLSSPVISTIVNTGTLTLPTSTDTLVGRATSDTLTNKTLTNPTVTNYTETLYTANTSTAITVDLANGTVQKLTLTGSATITMPTASAGKSFVIILAQDATGGRTVTWSTVVWPSATAPTITSTASKKDIYSFFADGTSWYGTTIGQNYT